ncbi:MAG: formate dehydrogenase accessory sulfurtransferase FdhD [Halobacteriota archaeon]
MKKEINCIKLNGERITESKDKVVIEEPLSIFVNGRHFVTTLISPQMKKEFVIGHLFSEGIIRDVEELESLQIEESIANVLLSSPLKVLAARKLIVSGCGGGASFLDESKLPKVSSDLKIDAVEVFEAVKSISGSDLHRITGGVHVVGLFNRRGRICISEDIGRHNALDKVIGYGLTENIDFEWTFVACTGRISSEMALKCSAANIPVVASRGATTSLAIEIAGKTGLCIIGFVRGERMNVYTNRGRIAATMPHTE